MKVALKIGKKTADNMYVISFDVADRNHDYRNYVTLNDYEWDGAARLDTNTVYTVTNIGTGETGNDTWNHYEGTLTTTLDPEIDIAAFGWGRIFIDNIMVKDTDGNILFSENFEASDYEAAPEPPVVEPTEGVHALSTKSDGWEAFGNVPGTSSEPTIKFGFHNGLQSNALRVLGNAKGVGKIRLPLPKKSSDDTYYITFTYVQPGNYTVKTVSIDLVGDNVYGPGCISSDGVIKDGITVSGTGDYLYIAFDGYGSAWLDNIVVRESNSSGKILFTEDFENIDTKYSYYTYETKLQGLSANGRSGKIYLSWRNPDRSDISSIKIYENDTELSDYTASIDTASGHVNIVEVTAASGSTHTYDVRMVTTGNVLYHNNVTGKEGTPFIYTTKTVGGEPINGWVLRWADGENVKALGKLEYDTNNKAEGTRSLHINPNITYTSANQSSAADKTTVRAQYSDGARINLDTSAAGIEAGKTYKLSWKQMGHRAGPYYVQLIMNDHAQNLGRMTVNNEYVTTPWQERELEFTVDSVGSTPMLRFEFSNGANDFWLDDVKLTEAGSNVNLLENGTFEPLSSYIYDAELYEVEQIENEYVILGTPDNLTGNTLIKSNVKIENVSETAPVSADVYTALYKDGKLISVDKVTLSAATGGTTSGGSVISIPAINDGVYSVKVFVWKSGEMKPLKNVTTLSE